MQAAVVIEADLELTVSDGQRSFRLSAAFTSRAPVVALYGPSGSGKSLTLRALAGLQQVDRGRVCIGGRTLLDTSRGVDLPPEHRGVGYLFQHYALFPHLTVRDNIAFGLTSWRRRLDAAGAQTVQRLLQAFGLETMARSRPEALSGGQQQRVALARALACAPQALLLDEPFAALNPDLRREVRQELKTLLATCGIPAVFITHDVEDVLDLADSAFVIEGGRVVREVDVAAATTDLTRSELAAEPPRPKLPGEDDLRARLTGAGRA
jgi:molybdate transport system ATP-binding protein